MFMTPIEASIAGMVAGAIKSLYGQDIPATAVSVEKTNREIKGDYTVVVFPFLRFSKKSPAETADEIGKLLIAGLAEIKSYEVIKGFLNLVVRDDYWIGFLSENCHSDDFGYRAQQDERPVLVEFSSPNTNKPLHLGHIRNNLLGYSLAEILKANGRKVIRLNLVNDRGIHICKSMLAWVRWGRGETPGSSGLKGDHLVGKYYVMFDRHHKEEIRELVATGMPEEEAFDRAPLMQEAKNMLRKWEDSDEETLRIWSMMNAWVYEGFRITYERLGIEFDHTDHESRTYLSGRKIVEEGLAHHVFVQKEDRSVWIDLSPDGYDEKLILRSDGTSVYITQDIGTALERHRRWQPSKMIYVVGNEQIYHFNILRLILHKLGKDWYDHIYHLSYGMVELPYGRMKSREGTVVDADDLLDEMYATARKTTEALGKVEGFTTGELENLYNMVGLGALKFFILKVDPKKNMLFNPEESIDFNGNTGPFIQYTYARIRSLVRKSEEDLEGEKFSFDSIILLEKERYLLKMLYDFPRVVTLAGDNLSPALIANYVFDLSREFNQYYQETPILKRIDRKTASFRVALAGFVGQTIKKSMHLLGIRVPEKM
jgi:arginyl-tRNA synthetase